MKEVRLKVNSLGETNKLAAKLAQNVKGGEVIGLIGDLGAGKTYFIKFFAEALGVKTEEVISPTFVFWRRYKGSKVKVNHFDFYRIENEAEAEGTGLEEAMEQKDAVTIIEWADRVRSYLPEDHLEIVIKFLGQTERAVDMKVYGDEYDYLLDNIEISS